jgi:predicted dehydrogenase
MPPKHLLLEKPVAVTVADAEAGGVVTVTTLHDGGARGHVALSGTTPGAGGAIEAEAVTDAGRVVLADPTPHQPGDVQRTIAAEFVRAVRGEIAQPLDVHRGVRLQRLLAAADRAIDTAQAVRP